MGGRRAMLFPPQMTFWQALQAGYVEPRTCPAYLDYLRGLPCAVTNSRQNVTVHHIIGHGIKAKGGKTSDYLAIPLIAELHLPDYPGAIHAGNFGQKAWEEKHGDQRIFTFQTLVRALHEGVLSWNRK